MDFTDFETFSNFLTDGEPIPIEEETIDFDEFPSISNEQMDSASQDHEYGNFLTQQSENIRNKQLEAHFDFDDDDDNDKSEAGSTNTEDEIAEAEAIDAEFPEGEAYDFVDPLPSQPGPNDPNNPCSNRELQEMIERTENVLEQLSMQAQVHVERQPLSTQILLANMAKEQVFKPYKQHGSQAQFSASVKKFLGGGDTIRRPGKAGLDKAKDGKLKFAPLDPFAEDVDAHGEEKRGKLKRKVSDGRMDTLKGPGGSERIKLMVVKRGDKLVSVMKSPDREQLEVGPDIEISAPLLQPADKSDGHDEPIDAVTPRKTSGPIDWAELEVAHSRQRSDRPEHADHDPAEALVNFNGASSLLPNSNHLDQRGQPTFFSPLADSFSRFQLQTPMSNFFPVQASAPQVPAYSCSIEPRTNSELALQPYNPVSMDIIWPGTSRSNGRPCAPPPGYLVSINRILQLYNAEARFLLSYYVRKYDTPFELGGGGPGGGGALRMGGQAKSEPPHALFRLGIAQYLMTKAERIVEHKELDELGLTPEARSILKSVWDEHPSMWTHFEDNFLEDEESDSEDEDMIVDGEDGDGDVIWVTDTPDGAEVRPTKKSYVPKKPDPQHVGGGLNPMEKTLLARACNISVDTVDAYWDMMRDKTKAWAAMKLWCRARSKEKIARAKAERRW